MHSEWRDAVKDVLPVTLGALIALLGFGLLRVSAILESWPLLFVALGLMVWGVTAVFTGNWRPTRDAVAEMTDNEG